MKKNKVKSIIRESIYNLLNEYSSEQRLPFDDDKFKNKNYLEQYADWLEDFGKYGKLPPSKMNFWDELRKAIQVIFDNGLKNRAMLSLGDDDDAERAFKELHEKIAPYLQFNSEGNIYAERAVKLKDSASDYNTSDENGQDPMQLYGTLVKNYNHNVGGCWAFREGKAETYCGEGKGDTILFRGYIRVEDIDMVKVALLNYNCDEFEFRTKPNAKVELFEVLFNNKYKLPLRGRLVVSASYFGNHGKYHGEYAPIDDGFGNVKEYMDREGNVYSITRLIKDLLSQGKSIDGISDNITPIGGGLYKLLMNDHFTIFDKHGNFFDDGNMWLRQVGDVHDGCAAIQREDGKWSFINSNNQQVGDWYYKVNDFGNGFARVQRDDGKWAFINTEGQQIGGWYDYVQPFKDGIGGVQRGDGKWSFINTEGQQIGGWYRYVTNHCNGMGGVQRDDEKWSFINAKGQEIGGWYDDVDDFRNGIASVIREDGKQTFINTQGQQICDWYRVVLPFRDGIGGVKRDDGKWSFINTQGKQICDWYDSTIVKNGCPTVYDKNKGAAIINKNGDVISPWFDDILSPSYSNLHIKNVLAACLNNKTAIINPQGQILSDWYDKLQGTSFQCIIAYRDGKGYILLDYNGKPLTHWFDKNHPAKVKIDGKIYFITDEYSYYNEQGEKVSPPASKIEPVIEAKKIALNNLITEALHSSIRDYLLYN